jgi:hypothetical protein
MERIYCTIRAIRLIREIRVEGSLVREKAIALEFHKLARILIILYNPRRQVNATVAQLAVQPIRNRQVISSNLIGGSTIAVVFPSTKALSGKEKPLFFLNKYHDQTVMEKYGCFDIDYMEPCTAKRRGCF